MKLRSLWVFVYKRGVFMYVRECSRITTLFKTRLCESKTLKSLWVFEYNRGVFIHLKVCPAIITLKKRSNQVISA